MGFFLFLFSERFIVRTESNRLFNKFLGFSWDWQILYVKSKKKLVLHIVNVNKLSTWVFNIINVVNLWFDAASLSARVIAIKLWLRALKSRQRERKKDTVEASLIFLVVVVGLGGGRVNSFWFNKLRCLCYQTVHETTMFCH